MKFALLIGSNYIHLPNNRLYGCINDIINIKNMLIDAYSYNANDFVILRDDKQDLLPTYDNIILHLTNLINNSSNYDEIWIHYSGHGSRKVDNNNDETTGYDSVIVPCDFQTKGYITDDILFDIIKNTKCPTILVFDCCNSGSICDLQWSFEKNDNSFIRYANQYHEIPNPNVFMISGCKDDQYSNDIYSTENNQSCGALTSSLIQCLRNSNHNISLFNLYGNICNELFKNGYTNQLPILSSSAETPKYDFKRNVIIQTITVTQPQNVTQQETVIEKKYSKIQQTIDNNMLFIMTNKGYRDPNKYNKKKKR